jgi:hypothetical protein
MKKMCVIFDAATQLIKRFSLRDIHWRRHQIEHAYQLIDRREFTICCFQCHNIANLTT